MKSVDGAVDAMKRLSQTIDLKRREKLASIEFQTVGPAALFNERFDRRIDLRRKLDAPFVRELFETTTLQAPRLKSVLKALEPPPKKPKT